MTWPLIKYYDFKVDKKIKFAIKDDGCFFKCAIDNITNKKIKKFIKLIKYYKF